MSDSQGGEETYPRIPAGWDERSELCLGKLVTCKPGNQRALEFKGYDYKLVMGDGGHDFNHGGSILPESLKWLWRD